MKSLILAFQFLTVFPIKKDMEPVPEELSGSMAWFPLVGAAQGLILVASDYLLSGLLPPGIVAGALVLILVLTNGGLHLDGFSDTVDGLAGGRTKEDRLRIMRDSSAGAIGVAFLIILILLKYLAIENIGQDARGPALFVFPAVGRWAMVPMAYMSEYARAEGGLGAAFTGISRPTLIKATVIVAALSALALGAFSLILIAVLWAVIYGFSRLFKRKLGGVTGDVFGFQSEIAEVLFLIMVLGLTNILGTTE